MVFEHPALFGAALVLSVAALTAIAVWARGRIASSEDYLVAGRRLGVPLAAATLFATWFGAGTLLVAADEVRSRGLRAAALDPLGAGLCLLLAGAFRALGNLPGQDLMQRVFSARSAAVARRACFAAGFGYLAFGAIPVLLGLAAALLAPGDHRTILPILAGLLLHPASAVLFVLAIVSAVLSTIDSAILAPAGVLAENLLARVPRSRLSRLALDQLAVIAVAAYLALGGVAPAPRAPGPLSPRPERSAPPARPRTGRA